MSAPHPLNQAVIAQALYDLRNGQLRRCKAMGFGEAELDALKHPELISVLANASVSWCSVTVNREVLRRLLQQALALDETNGLIAALKARIIFEPPSVISTSIPAEPSMWPASK